MKKTFAILLSMALFMPIYTLGSDFESIINSEASINKEVAPDTVSIKFYIENSGTNVAEIKDKNDKMVNNAIAQIKKHLGNDDTIKTISYRINNIYSYQNKVRIFQKYEVINGFEVKLKDLNKISTVIKTATDNGVKRVEQLNFSVSNSENICNQFMADAAKMAKNRAKYIANSVGNDILKVKNINTYCSLSSSHVQPRMYANKMMSMDSAGAATEESAIESIEPGTINVRATANMAFYLK